MATGLSNLPRLGGQTPLPPPALDQPRSRHLTIAIELTTRTGILLMLIAFCHAAAGRLRLPDSLLLTAIGVLLGGGYLLLGYVAPHIASSTIAPFLSPSLPPEAYLWIFLPPILFQAAMEVDASELLADIGPVLLLAVGAVIAATVCIGATAWLISGQGLIVCLLLGAIVSTTDPSTVIALFQRSGAPARLIRLIEGESLFNDAAAIALSTLLIAALGGSAAHSLP